jgi:hemoglobin/transferrin/lactoferrin receptor protein
VRLHLFALSPLTVAIGIAASSMSYAEQAQKAKNDSIETMVVVGEATNAQIDYKDLEAFQANDLADVFRTTPSISVGGGASGIAQKVYVRGLEDSMVNVTVDGAPQTSTLFHHIGRVTIDPDLLKQVEVQAGAGEATSGAGAIGGSIRFLTKDVDDLLAAGEDFGGRVKVSNYSNDGEQHSLTLFGRLNDNWGVVAYYNDIDRNNAEDGDGNELPATAADQTLGFFKISGDITDNQHLSLSYETRKEKGSFTRQPNWSPLEGVPLYKSEGERETYVANYQLNHNDLLNLEVSAYHTESSFERELYTWKTDITSYGFDIRNVSEIGIHRFTYGIDLREDEVESGPIGDTTAAREEGTVWGAYAQAHTQVTDKLLVSYGVRYDDYAFDQRLASPNQSFDSDDVSFNAGFAYDITDAWKFSLGYAEAARGKEIGDGFTIDSSTTDPQLDAETVTNIEASLEYNTTNLNVKLAAYQSEIDDVIFDQNYAGVFYENVGTVETDGVELDLTYRWNELEIQFGFATSDAQLDPADGVYSVDYGKVDLAGYEHRGLGNSRGDTWNLGINYYPLPNLTFGWNITHVEDLNNLEVFYRDNEFVWGPGIQEIDKDGYTVHDLYAEWSPMEHLKINLAVTNVFDKNYLDHSSVGDYTEFYPNVKGYNEPGRDVRLSATYSF